MSTGGQRQSVLAEQVAADLYAAADLIEASGWARYDYEDERGGHCIAGAVNQVVTGAPNAWPDEDPRLVAAKSAFWHSVGMQPIQFNEQAEDGTEVVSAMRRAAQAVLT